MSDLPFKALIQRLYKYLLKYVTTYFEYFRYEAAERIIKSISYVISNVVTLLLVVICLNITFLALVIGIGVAMDALSSALIIIGIVYLVVALVLAIFRKPLILRPLQNQLVSLLFNDPPS